MYTKLLKILRSYRNRNIPIDFVADKLEVPHTQVVGMLLELQVHGVPVTLTSDTVSYSEKTFLMRLREKW